MDRVCPHEFALPAGERTCLLARSCGVLVSRSKSICRMQNGSADFRDATLACGSFRQASASRQHGFHALFVHLGVAKDSGPKCIGNQ